jgi:hypothetical protein
MLLSALAPYYKLTVGWNTCMSAAKISFFPPTVCTLSLPSEYTFLCQRFQLTLPVHALCTCQKSSLWLKFQVHSRLCRLKSACCPI